MTPATASILEILRNAKTRSDVADLLGVSASTLSYWLYKAPSSLRYRRNLIPKKNGGTREILEPQGNLKNIQSKLASILSSIYEKAEQQRLTPPRPHKKPSAGVLAHGFKQNYDIRTNASVHRGQKFVFNVDLKDFFPSITFGRVRGFFIKDLTFRLNPDVATIIAQISCYEDALPQGSPCSPVISNLVAHILDIKLNKLARHGKCSYTRYADDLTFSTNELSFPATIARCVAGTSDRWVTGNELARTIWGSGFRINHDKTRMQLSHSRQETTGLTVNKKINVPADYYKQVRAMCDHLFKNGYAYERYSRYDASRNVVDNTHFVRNSSPKYCHLKGGFRPISDARLQGRLDFIYSIRANRRKDDLERLPKIERPKAYMLREEAFRHNQVALTSLYKKLLDYRSFHGMDAPVIVGEGITDALYIRAAIRTIGGSFPKLFKTHGTDYRILVDFFKHTDRRKFYQIGEGAPGLKKFVTEFPVMTQPFNQHPNFPVIVIVDNDPAGRDVLKACAKHGLSGLGQMTRWAHVIQNLYIMPVPANLDAAGVPKDTAIEDLFEPAVFEPLSGRTFTKENDFDKSRHYGKSEFVQQIVRPKRTTIKWDNFAPLLSRIEEIIDDYRRIPVARK